ncbi:MAG TPA: hypothetical protein VMV69_09085 [Pirellulales bacterium]|nr:hypothetical protein [Pirellulales bacterium]
MISPASLEGGGLRVVFTRHADRYAHAVFRAVTARRSASKAAPADPSLAWAEGALLESIEGTPDDEWPASPALKELHFEDRADGRRLALLVGMAGKSHWSLSVELDAAASRLTFDVACRLRGAPERLGSRYRFSAAAAECFLPPLTIEPIDGELGRLVTSVDGQLDIEPPAVAGLWPRTVRWRYAVRA